MKKLVSIFAAGALVLAVAPSVFAASNVQCYQGYTQSTPVSCSGATTLNVTVDTGTSIYVPATITIADATNHAFFPGMYATSGTETIKYYSNQASSEIQATFDGPLHGSGADAARTIAVADIELSTSDMGAEPQWSSFDPFAAATAKTVATIAFTDNNENQTPQDFKLRVKVPSAKAITYTTTITWSVNTPF